MYFLAFMTLMDKVVLSFSSIRANCSNYMLSAVLQEAVNKLVTVSSHLYCSPKQQCPRFLLAEQTGWGYILCRATQPAGLEHKKADAIGLGVSAGAQPSIQPIIGHSLYT